ncbi:MAG: sulfotransferase [Pseudomonadota bacterium]
MTPRTKRRPLILHIGLPKTATTTLARALRRAGLKTVDWRMRAHQTENEALHDQMVGEILYEGYYRQGDPLHYFAGFDAIAEMSALGQGRNFWPQTDWGLLDAIRTRYPQAKFLLSERNPDDVADSMLRWNSLGTDRLPRHPVPGLPAGYGTSAAELARWVAGHYAFCRRVFAGSGQFLAYDPAAPDAAARIGTFIGRDLPWWGQSNVNHATPPMTKAS